MMPSSTSGRTALSGGVGGGGVGVVDDAGVDVRDLNANLFFGSTLAFSAAIMSPISFNCYFQLYLWLSVPLDIDVDRTSVGMTRSGYTDHSV